MYSYPDNGQTEVAAPSPVVLRFTSSVSEASADSAITLHEGDANGALVAIKQPVELAPDGKGVILTPTNPLQAHQPYTVVVDHLALSGGTLNKKTIHFTTRAAQEGPKSEVVENNAFELVRRFPDNSSQQPVMDFSTFRLQFSQPIDPSTAHYGQNATSGAADNVALVDQNGDLVPATLIVDGPYMTIDPKAPYLNAGQHYTLTVGTGLASTYGKALAQPDNLQFSPLDSTPKGEDPAVLVQYITDAKGGSVLSPLTSKPVNVVAVKGTLLGENGKNATQADAVVRAELADPVTYTNVLPIRIPKGTVLTGSSIDIKIGGLVDAGYDSGKVTMTLISDATGYMVTNPYSTQTDAPRIVHLFMDVGITTADLRANGGFTQNLLHIELVGTSKVDAKAGVLDLDAISVVQPDVLGLEYGYAVLSFQLKSYRDQTTAPAPVADTTAPKVQSWTFGTDQETGLDKTAMLKPTDPLIINFDKPLDPQSVIGHVHLIRTEDGTPTEMDAKVTVDGAAIVIKPAQPLEHPEETGPDISYQVKLDSGITDVSGNAWTGSFDQSFALGVLVEKADKMYYAFGSFYSPNQTVDVNPKSPFILGLYPGFPCPLNTATRDLQNGLEGRCIGGIQPNPNDDLGSLAPPTYDDILPVSNMPANRPIVVVFSDAIDPASLFNDAGEAVTFQVHEIDPANPDVSGARVPGTVTLNGDTLRFVPDSPWEKGQYYAYTIHSNGNVKSSVAQCDANSPDASLCSKKRFLIGTEQVQLPIMTQTLAVTSAHHEAQILPQNFPAIFQDWPVFFWEEDAESPDLTTGGPDLTQYFVGAEPSPSVLQLLRLSQVIDSNKNLVNDSTPTMFGPVGGTTSGGGGSMTGDRGKFFEYGVDETGDVQWESDPSTADLYDSGMDLPMDPDGVAPPPNSAKILSSLYGYTSIDQFPKAPEDPNGSLRIASQGATVGGNIGCGWVSNAPYEDQTGCEGGIIAKVGGTFGRYCFYMVPAECPKDKFTYLHGVLFAEVTPEVVKSPDGQDALKVNIFPGHMITTSFKTYLKQTVANVTDVADSGYQVMRMRYPSGASTITGYIEDGAGAPKLSTTVKLYLDAPYLVSDFVDVKNLFASLNHNFYSYPISMELAGGIRFLADGRMVIEQHNLNAVKFDLRASAPATMVDLMVPKGGTFIQYVSEPIK